MADLRKQLSDYFEGMVKKVEASDARSRSTSIRAKSEGPHRFRQRPLAVAATAAISVLVAGGLAFGIAQWLGVSDADVIGATSAALPTTAVPDTAVPDTAVPDPTSSTAPLPADAPLLSWRPMQRPPDLNTVDHMVATCCINVLFGSDQWTAGWGEVNGRPYITYQIPSDVRPILSIAANGVLGMIAAPEASPPTEPEVVAIEAELGPSRQDWTHVPLPTDVPNSHPSVIVHYRPVSVAFSGTADYAVFGFARPEVDAAAIEAAYPDLAPVVRADLLPPCCDGVPVTTYIPDPLWVYTTDPASEPIAISLSTLDLTRDDLQRTTGVVWLFQRPFVPSPYVATTVLIIDDIDPEAFLASGNDDGFVLLTRRPSGGYDTWISATGESWSQLDLIPDEVIDLEIWGDRPLALTAEGSLLELSDHGTWTTLADPDAFDLAGAQAAWPTSLAAGDAGVVVVGEREQVLSWSGGEPIPTAQVLWFSADGTTWSHQELTDLLGAIGAVEVLVTRHQGNREGPPLVIVALGVDQANGELITDPEWWIAEPITP